MMPGEMASTTRVARHRTKDGADHFAGALDTIEGKCVSIVRENVVPLVVVEPSSGGFQGRNSPLSSWHSLWKRGVNRRPFEASPQFLDRRRDLCMHRRIVDHFKRPKVVG